MIATPTHRGLVSLLACTFAFITPTQSEAAESARTIAARSLKSLYYAGQDARIRVEMTLTNARGKKRRRKMSMLRKNSGKGGEQRYYVFFHAPADVKGTSFMVWKYPRKDDDRWIFMPAINLVRRIAASDKRSSFIGSDFTYEDLSGRDVDDEHHKLIREETLDGRACHLLESQPKGRMDYVRRLSWIDKQTSLPLKEEYYDARGKKIRLFLASKVEKVDARYTVLRRTMKNLQTGHSTEVLFKKVAYDVGLQDDLFTERYLRRPPRSQLR